MAMPATNQPPTYEQAAGAYNAYNEVQAEKEAGIIDKTYVKGIPAFLKYAEILLTLIAYICVEVTVACAPYLATFGFFTFVSMFAFTVTVMLYVFLLLKLQKRILRCDCINWNFVEMCYYGGLVVAFFFANLFLALHGCKGGHKAGCVFGYLALIVYGADGGFAFRRWWTVRQETRAQALATDDTVNPHNEPSY